MTRMRLVTAALTGVSLAAMTVGAALAPTTVTGAPAHRALTARSQVDPDAVAALQRMSAYLRSLPAFQITLTTERDDVDDFGQVLTFDGQATYQVRSPDRFSAKMTDRDGTRQYIYDGRSVTVLDPRTDLYARFDAPPTTRQTLDLAREKYDLTVPLDDLFHWDQGDSLESQLTSAHYVGPTVIDGQGANQYAFRQSGLDWQIWIASGDKPLPLRVVLVARDDPGRPQFEANLAWDTAPQFTTDTFVFTPPAGARMVAIAADAR